MSVPVETALRQLDVRLQNATENVRFHLADRRISRREILIRTVVLAQNRQTAVDCAAHVITMTLQLVSELPNAVIQTACRINTAKPPHKLVPNQTEHRTPGGLILNLMNRAPHNECQVAVIFTEMPQACIAHSINMMRSASTGTHDLADHQPLAFQPSQPLPHRRRRDPDIITNLLNRSPAKPVELLKKLLIILVNRDSHLKT